MQVIYRAYDGVDFTTKAECQHHEMNEPLFKMWTTEGMTQSIEDAEVVEIFNWEGYENFKEICQENDWSTEGIDEPGIYIWNGDEWISMEGFPLAAISQYLRATEAK